MATMGLIQGQERYYLTYEQLLRGTAWFESQNNDWIINGSKSVKHGVSYFIVFNQ